MLRCHHDITGVQATSDIIKLPEPTGPFYWGHLSSHSVIPYVIPEPSRTNRATTDVMILTTTSPEPVQNSLARTVRTLTPAPGVILGQVLPQAEQIQVRLHPREGSVEKLLRSHSGRGTLQMLLSRSFTGFNHEISQDLWLRSLCITYRVRIGKTLGSGGSQDRVEGLCKQ